MRNLRINGLPISLCESEAEVGIQAARAFTDKTREYIRRDGTINVILACASSQSKFLEKIRASDQIDWSRIRVFHMDEYERLPESDGRSFRGWLRFQLLQFINPLHFEGIRGDSEDVGCEVRRYRNLLRRFHPHIVVMGIGDNGHLAFNEPPVDFDDARRVRITELADASRLQQVVEGHFQSIAEVPEKAITLTVGALLEAESVLVLVPGIRKAAAVEEAIASPLSGRAPGSVLRVHPDANLFLDPGSASRLGDWCDSGTVVQNVG